MRNERRDWSNEPGWAAYRRGADVGLPLGIVLGGLAHAVDGWLVVGLAAAGALVIGLYRRLRAGTADEYGVDAGVSIGILGGGGAYAAGGWLAVGLVAATLVVVGVHRRLSDAGHRDG